MSFKTKHIIYQTNKGNYTFGFKPQKTLQQLTYFVNLMFVSYATQFYFKYRELYLICFGGT